MPVRLRDAEVDAVIQEALDALPPAVADALSDAVVTVVPLPARHPDVDPLSLGLYVGTDRMQRSIEDGPTLPPRIEVYRRNVERIAADRAEAVHELRTTLLHEIGHHLGFDEEGVAHLGLE
jgi:predicted Zn-dependent protease with MMP-like domain